MNRQSPNFQAGSLRHCNRTPALYFKYCRSGNIRDVLIIANFARKTHAFANSIISRHFFFIDKTIRYSDYYKTCTIGKKTYIIMIIKKHNYHQKTQEALRRCPSSVGEQKTNAGPVHRISIKHERLEPASSTLAKPCPCIGPNLRAWWVPRKHDTSTQC